MSTAPNTWKMENILTDATQIIAHSSSFCVLMIFIVNLDLDPGFLCIGHQVPLNHAHAPLAVSQTAVLTVPAIRIALKQD
jgi:hypothetical protein